MGTRASISVPCIRHSLFSLRSSLSRLAGADGHVHACAGAAAGDALSPTRNLECSQRERPREGLAGSTALLSRARDERDMQASGGSVIRKERGGRQGRGCVQRLGDDGE